MYYIEVILSISFIILIFLSYLYYLGYTPKSIFGSFASQNLSPLKIQFKNVFNRLLWFGFIISFVIAFLYILPNTLGLKYTASKLFVYLGGAGIVLGIFDLIQKLIFSKKIEMYILELFAISILLCCVFTKWIVPLNWFTMLPLLLYSFYLLLLILSSQREKFKNSILIPFLWIMTLVFILMFGIWSIISKTLSHYINF